MKSTDPSDLPKTAKRGFGFPVPADDWMLYTHPDPLHDFAFPAILDGSLIVSNGWLAIRAERFQIAAQPDASPAMAKRFRAIEFPQDSPHWNEESRKLRPLDDVIPTLFRFGPRHVWEKGMLKWHPRVKPAIRIGTGAVVPLAMLQAVSMLPRAEIATVNDARRPVPFRFNGGIGVMHNFLDHHKDEPAPSVSIFMPSLR